MVMHHPNNMEAASLCAVAVGVSVWLKGGASPAAAALAILWRQAIYGDRQFVTALQPWRPSGDGPYANDRGVDGVEGDHDTG